MAHFAKLDENNKVLEVHFILNDDLGNADYPESEALGVTKLTNDTGKIMSITYWFEKKDIIDVDCYDWSKKSGYLDQLRIGATSYEFNDWLTEK